MEDRTALLIGIDAEIADLICEQLVDLGYSMERVADARLGLTRLQERQFDLAVVELDLSSQDLMSGIRKVREEFQMLPIFALTRSTLNEVEEFLGEELLADDYLQIPFHPSEFSARTRALLRRASLFDESSLGDSPLSFGELVIDDSGREVRLCGNLLDLTPTEYDLLKLFVSSPGRLYSREELLRMVWNNELSNYEYNVTTHVSRLRNKIAKESPRYAECIQTVRGVGYRFVREFSD